MKCRKCEAIITEGMIRCSKCGALIVQTQKSSKSDFHRQSKYDIILVNTGTNKEELINLLKRVPVYRNRNIEKDLENLPFCIFRDIPSERIPKIKERLESVGAQVKIRESKENDKKEEVKKSFWKRNKLLIEISAAVFLISVLFIVFLVFSSRKYVPGIYKSKSGLKQSQKTAKYRKPKSLTFNTEDGRNVDLDYSILSEDIIDSESQAHILTKLEIDENVPDKAAEFIIRKISEEQKKKKGFKYFDSPNEVEVILYNKGSEQKYGKDAWRYKYSSQKGSLGKLIAQNLKRINGYPYSKFNNRRFAYYLSKQFENEKEINSEINLLPPESKANDIQIGIIENNPKINRKIYLSKVASKVGAVLKEVDIKCEGVFVKLPSGSYYISSDLCMLAYTKLGNDFKNDGFVDFIWRNILKNEKK